MPDTPLTLLFVCTGNTCRSPMAEVIARELVRERGLGAVAVQSAGIAADELSGASEGSLLVAMERGLDLSRHRSRQLTRAMVDGADLVLTMGPSHLAAVQSLGGETKAALLADYATYGESQRPVSDPIGGELPVYRATYEELHRLIQRALDRWLAERPSRTP
ncbi:MAG: low molecular weight protein arginine phosphatase [Gemmatimonadaceae bacterium]|jgi:protein-tyrosine phosphatase|nr:low molecular weight protein arginine phosphatase [Gemmatimonadaceae bacterium]